MGKWAKPDLYDLENDLSNNSIKSISWQLINIIREKLYTNNNKSYCTVLGEKVTKFPNLTFVLPFGHWQITFRAIQSTAHFGSPFVPSLGSFMPNRENVIRQFLRKLHPSEQLAKFDLSYLAHYFRNTGIYSQWEVHDITHTLYILITE